MSIKDKVVDFFKKTPPISGGNTLEVQARLKAQTAIDLSNVEKPKGGVLGKVKEIFNGKQALTQFIKERIPEEYWLLQLQANYFCNIIKFRNDNNDTTALLIKVIRCAFFSGKAGVYKNELTNQLEGYTVVNVDLNYDGSIKRLDVVPVDLYMQSTSPDYNKTIWKIKDKETINKFIIFSWGTIGVGAWVLMYPFIKQQHMLLTMLNTQAFTYMKKFTYKVNDPLQMKEEMELFFDPTNPFLISSGMGDDLSNKFAVFDFQSSNQKDFINYYYESMRIWYELFGRKLNLDNKKERNVSSEVEASQDQFENLHLDIINQFRIFKIKFNEMYGSEYGKIENDEHILEEALISEEDLIEDKEKEKIEYKGEKEND